MDLYQGHRLDERSRHEPAFAEWLTGDNPAMVAHQQRVAASRRRVLAGWRRQAVIMLTGHAFMIALDARTGRPVESFGDKGWVDLSQDLGRPVAARWHYGNTSPPVIVRDVIVVGSSVLNFPLRKAMPPGDVRGFDVRTGRKLWTVRHHPREEPLEPRPLRRPGPASGGPAAPAAVQASVRSAAWTRPSPGARSSRSAPADSCSTRRASGTRSSRRSSGIGVDGDDNTVDQNRGRKNGFSGLEVGFGNGNSITRNTFDDNAESGISVFADGGPIDGNRGQRNGMDGLAVAGIDNTVSNNTFNRNAGTGICVGAGNIDGGGNRAQGNGGDQINFDC